MGVSSSFVFRERNSSQSMKFVDDDEITMLNDWEVIEDDLEDDEEPTKKFDEMFTTRLPSSEIFYIRPSLSEGLSYLGDLKSKSDYVLQDEKITTAFVRYLFQGMWIPELLQIPVVSSPASSPTHSATQPIFPEYKFDGVFLSSCVDDDSWKPLLKSLDALCGNPSSAAVLASENPLIAIVDKVCVKRGDSAFLLTLAVAMQAFCRSEVFLQLSEQQWSPEAFRSIVWTDYARVGRAVVVQHYQQQLLQTEAEGGDVTRGHIALLDALYVHLMTTSSQRDTLDYLRPASDENASHWLQDLQAVMLSLPVSWAVYETKASNAASLPKEDSTPTVFACQQQSGLLKSLLSWQCLFHTGSKHAPATQASPTTPLIVPIHCYAASTAQSILRRLHTTTAATQLAFPVLTTDASPEAHLCFECIQPILRCPLLAFDRDGNLSEVTTGYRWDVHRAVAAQVNVNFTSALPLVLAQDVAFLLSHIIG
eukprot:gene9323-6680_t